MKLLRESERRAGSDDKKNDEAIVASFMANDRIAAAIRMRTMGELSCRNSSDSAHGDASTFNALGP